MYKLPVKEWKFDKLELGINNKEIDHQSLHLPPLSTCNQYTFNLGNETKHKGTTKCDGGLAICDSYGNEELKGDEQSRDEEVWEGGNGRKR